MYMNASLPHVGYTYGGQLNTENGTYTSIHIEWADNGAAQRINEYWQWRVCNYTYRVS